VSSPAIQFSKRSQWTTDPAISYFVQKALENPHLISLAAGLVDAGSLPAADVQEACDFWLANPYRARAALQYGTTHGYAPLREKLLARLVQMDNLRSASDIALTADEVVITTGSQQLLYLVGEALLDPGDIVITEAPSYFVYQGTLSSMGVRTLAVPMDDDGMRVDLLEELLQRLETSGELERVKLIYVCDYFQNPTGLNLSQLRRRRVLELAQQYSKKQRIFILEDAAYRELRYEGIDVPSIKSLDTENKYVILAQTFSKACAPGLKTGYGFLPRDLLKPVLRLKGNHDFGSNNLTQHLLDRVLDTTAYDRHVVELCAVYHNKRDILLTALAKEFQDGSVHWTRPKGGLYVWLRFGPEVDTGPDGALMQAALHEGVLYVPGAFCYMDGGGTPNCEARLCYGVVTPEQLSEGTRRLAAARRASRGLASASAS
jgi:2-aminoadipate transaminase